MKLELRGITKRFPGVVANEGIDLVVQPGEIHGLLGENGAGKSTLMNVLYGLYQPDEGEILIDDKPVTFNGPGDAIAAGIGMVHQHFMLVPVFTVTENVMLGVETTQRTVRAARPPGRAGPDHRDLRASTACEVDPDAIVEDLPVGVRQRVEIIKTLYRKSDVLILDEPSAVLTPQETEELFDGHALARRPAAPRSSSSPTSSTRCSRSPTASPSCAAGRWSARPRRPRPPARSWRR